MNCGFFPFPCKYRSRDPTQTTSELIHALICPSYPNGSPGHPDFRFHPDNSCRNVCIPVVLCSHAVEFPGNIVFSIPRAIERSIKEYFPPVACTGCLNRNITYVFIYWSKGGMASDRSQLFGVLHFCGTDILFRVFRCAYTYCSDVVVLSKRLSPSLSGSACRVISRSGLG